MRKFLSTLFLLIFLSGCTTDYEGEIQSLQDENEELQEQVDQLEQENQELKNKLDNIQTYVSDGQGSDYDTAQSSLDDIETESDY